MPPLPLGEGRGEGVPLATETAPSPPSRPAPGSPTGSAPVSTAARLAASTGAHVAILLGGSYFLLFHGLWRGEVKPLDDGWNSGVARRIAEGGSWLSPTLQDGEFHNHGALVHWVTAILMRLFGVHPGIPRLTGAAFGLALILALYFAGKRFVTPFAAFVAAVGLLTYEPFFHIAPRPLMDVPVTLWVFLAIVAIDAARERPWAGYLAAGAFTGLAVLTKDLAGLAPVPIAFLLPFVERRPKALLHPAPYAGLLVAAALVCAWLVPQHLLEGSAWIVEYLKFGKWGIEEGAYPDRGPFFYAVHLAMNYWPWFPIFLFALAGGARKIARREPYRLAVHGVAFVVIFAAWSAVAHKTIRYMMLFYPSTQLMVGDQLDRWLRSPTWRAAFTGIAAAAILGLGVAQVGFGFDLHVSRSLDGDRVKDLAPKALAAALPMHELCAFRVHRYFLAAAFSYYRGPTVPVALDLPDAGAVRAYLAPGSSRRCITTREALGELADAYPTRMEADGYVVVGAPP